MRRFLLVCISGSLLLTSCNDAKKPSDTNLTVAIDQYLSRHGEACSLISRQFPVDVPRSQPKDQYGIGSKLAALEQAGLLHASDTTAVVHGMLDALNGPTRPQPVRHSELTDEGKKYFRLIPGGVIGQTAAFCYGQKSVYSIIKRTDPVSTGGTSQTEVIYTYKMTPLATWAGRIEVQQAFPDIKATIDGASRANQVAGLQLTNKGWEVPGT